MGQSYVNCANCGEAFGDYSDYVNCNCGELYCCDECAEESGYVDDETSELYDTCKFCRCEDYTDDVLLEFALEFLKMSREDLISAFKMKNL